MFRFTYSKLLHPFIHRKLSPENFSIQQGTSSMAVPLRLSRLMLVEISGKVLNREHPLRFSSERDWRLIPVGRVSRFMHPSIVRYTRRVNLSIEQGIPSMAVSLRSSFLLLVEIWGKVLNLEHPLRSRRWRDPRLIPVGRVSRFTQLLIFNLLSLWRFLNEEGSSTKPGLYERSRYHKEGDMIGVRRVRS